MGTTTSTQDQPHPGSDMQQVDEKQCTSAPCQLGLSKAGLQNNRFQFKNKTGEACCTPSLLPKMTSWYSPDRAALLKWRIDWDRPPG